MIWEFVPVVPGKQTIPNLHTCQSDFGPGVVGFIEKPKDTPTEKNYWRAFSGVGWQANFLGHAPTKAGAKRMVEAAAL